MQIKEIKPINFLFFRAETKVNELEKFLPVAQELIAEAVKHSLFVTGPVHWHYFGFAGDVDQSFILEISLPVAEVLQVYDGKFHFKRTEQFKCVSLIHEGSWYEIPKSYEKAFVFIGTNDLKPMIANRELYINVDFNDPQANSTELQIGIH
jgi:effector-binding domain-containing protein